MKKLNTGHRVGLYADIWTTLNADDLLKLNADDQTKLNADIWTTLNADDLLKVNADDQTRRWMLTMPSNHTT